MLREATEDEDVQGIDLCTDMDFSSELLYVQIKSNFDNWLYAANTKGTPQWRQRKHYELLVETAPVYIYDEANDQLISFCAS